MWETEEKKLVGRAAGVWVRMPLGRHCGAPGVGMGSDMVICMLGMSLEW